jgi:hypothetical protein
MVRRVSNRKHRWILEGRENGFAENAPKGELLMKIFRAAALLALLAGPAYGQMSNINIVPDAKSRTPEEIERDKATDKAYRDSLRKIPDARVNDPWGNVRGPDSRKVVQPKPRSKSDDATGR